MLVKHVRSDSDNFREYYRGQDRNIYCTQPKDDLTLPQWRAQGRPVDWYICTSDGEPCCKVKDITIATK